VKIGLLVNPVAGMGGSVGLKGTDGPDMAREAAARGGEKVSPARATYALRDLADRGLNLEIVTCSGEMGASELTDAGLLFRVVHETGQHTSAKDTKAAVQRFLDEGVDIIVFAGGDGTARDIAEVVGRKVPVVGIPAGVKMQSGVFVNEPRDLADLLEAFADEGRTRGAEVMDVDESLFREGKVEARLYAMVEVPDDHAHMQSSKEAYHSGTADEETEEIAHYIAETVVPGTLCILGPGSTTAKVAEVLGKPKTLLGVDVFRDGEPCCQDASEKDLLRVLDGSDLPARIVVTPIGAQGFFFGRGNQQISPKVIRAAGPENVVVIATPTKLRGTPVLRADTGDPELDLRFKGKAKVVTGYKRKRLVTVE